MTKKTYTIIWLLIISALVTGCSALTPVDPRIAQAESAAEEGSAAFKNKDYAYSIGHYLRASELIRAVSGYPLRTTLDRRYQFNIATAHQNLGNTAAAIRHYEESLGLDPMMVLGSDGVYDRLNELYLRTGEKLKAERLRKQRVDIRTIVARYEEARRRSEDLKGDAFYVVDARLGQDMARDFRVAGYPELALIFERQARESQRDLDDTRAARRIRSENPPVVLFPPLPGNPSGSSIRGSYSGNCGYGGANPDAPECKLPQKATPAAPAAGCSGPGCATDCSPGPCRPR